jgi:hypothetical protein
MRNVSSKDKDSEDETYEDGSPGKGMRKATKPSRTSNAGKPKSRLSVVTRPQGLGVPITSTSATVVQGTKIPHGQARTSLNALDGQNVQVQVPRQVMDDNFEEWMKLATDNVSS